MNAGLKFQGGAFRREWNSGNGAKDELFQKSIPGGIARLFLVGEGQTNVLELPASSDARSGKPARYAAMLGTTSSIRATSGQACGIFSLSRAAGCFAERQLTKGMGAIMGIKFSSKGMAGNVAAMAIAMAVAQTFIASAACAQQSELHAYHIPSGPLDRTLVEIAKITQLPLSYDASLVQSQGFAGHGPGPGSDGERRLHAGSREGGRKGGFVGALCNGGTGRHHLAVDQRGGQPRFRRHRLRRGIVVHLCALGRAAEPDAQIGQRHQRGGDPGRIVHPKLRFARSTETGRSS